ncbi:MAG: cation:proton antiporter subunit C [Candidatus Desulfofervidaceae bacterium]|nr:cation:proton antiporter subunit C [Candidatus Desulfofervidaceae bacterium]
MLDFIIGRYNYWIYIILMMMGFYGMMGKRNLMKKLIGMNIFQTAIILYFISTGSKKGGTVPILPEHGHEVFHHMAINPADYINPLPHVLMLTAIVVGIATTGVALALIILIYREYETLEEDKILEMRKNA